MSDAVRARTASHDASAPNAQSSRCGHASRTWKPKREDDGHWTFKPGRVPVLARVLEVGDLLYTPPASSDVPESRWFDARKGESPRLAELRAGLAARWITLRAVSPYWWQAEGA